MPDIHYGTGPAVGCLCPDPYQQCQGSQSPLKQPAESPQGSVYSTACSPVARSSLHSCHLTDPLRQRSPLGQLGITAWLCCSLLPGNGPCQQEQGRCQACHCGCANQFHCGSGLRMLEPACVSLQLMLKTLERDGRFLTVSFL